MNGDHFSPSEVALSSSKVAFCIPEVALSSSKVAFCIPKVAFSSSKVAFCIPEVAFSSPKVAFSIPEGAFFRSERRIGYFEPPTPFYGYLKKYHPRWFPTEEGGLRF